MSLTYEDVLAECGADSTDASLAGRVLESADELVAAYLGSATRPDPVTGEPITIPDSIRDDAVRVCAVDLFNRAKAPNGVLMSQFDPTGEGAGVVIQANRDPLLSVRPILAPWTVPLGFA